VELLSSSVFVGERSALAISSCLRLRAEDMAFSGVGKKEKGEERKE
jgi:hypothetical protein